MYRNEWLPHALVIGISEEQFWEMNPRKIKPYEKAHNYKCSIADENNWLLGKYIMCAIASSLNDKNKYPDKPFLKEYYEDMELTQEERDEKELKKMLLYEEMWQINDKNRGLPTTNIV